MKETRRRILAAYVSTAFAVALAVVFAVAFAVAFLVVTQKGICCYLSP
jgi:hypothetical protein